MPWEENRAGQGHSHLDHCGMQVEMPDIVRTARRNVEPGKQFVVAEMQGTQAIEAARKSTPAPFEQRSRPVEANFSRAAKFNRPDVFIARPRARVFPGRSQAKGGRGCTLPGLIALAPGLNEDLNPAATGTGNCGLHLDGKACIDGCGSWRPRSRKREILNFDFVWVFGAQVGDRSQNEFGANARGEPSARVAFRKGHRGNRIRICEGFPAKASFVLGILLADTQERVARSGQMVPATLAKP